MKSTKSIFEKNHSASNLSPHKPTPFPQGKRPRDPQETIEGHNQNDPVTGGDVTMTDTDPVLSPTFHSTHSYFQLQSLLELSWEPCYPNRMQTNCMIWNAWISNSRKRNSSMRLVHVTVFSTQASAFL